MRILTALIASSLALSVAVPPPSADACGNPIQLAGNKAVKKVRALEELLKAGKNQKVVNESYRVNFDDQKLRFRAELVITVAAMRLDEEDVPMMYWHMRGEGFPDNYGPLEHLRALQAQADESPVIQARIAEALLRKGTVAAHVEEATKLLEDLATRDLIPDAEAWASLADVRARAADTAGAEAALAQCKKVARGARRTAICKLSAPSS